MDIVPPKNKHKGQRCFVVASGPSLRGMDLSWLKDEITIAVNQSYLALDFPPTYLAIGDRSLWPMADVVQARRVASRLVIVHDTVILPDVRRACDDIGGGFHIDCERGFCLFQPEGGQ